MTIENNEDNGEGKRRYSIDMDWYREQERSFTLLATSRLCPSSQKKRLPKSQTAILNTLKQCCSKSEEFITPDMPLTESIFRIFLANSNKPLTLQQIQTKLQQRLSDISGSRDLSIPRLKRILDCDSYYGLMYVDATDEDEEEPNTAPQSD